MKQFHDLLEDVLENGFEKGDRTGTGTISVFGRQMRFDLREGFPLLTTKFVSMKNIDTELRWFLKGDTNTRYLKEHGCNIWNEWALSQSDLNKFEYPYCDEGDLGPVYGKQWRSWGSDLNFGVYSGIDQISEVINLLKTKPDSRRIIVSAWNVADLPDESISPQENVLKGKMALAPCHLLFQFYSREMTSEEKCHYLGSLDKDNHDKLFSDDFDDYGDDDYAEVEKYFEENILPKRYLSCQLYIRSNDLFLGCPYNIASYALLTHMIAQCVNMVPHEFISTIGDAHIYSNHIDQVKELLSRDYNIYELPTLKLNPDIKNIDDFKREDIVLENYQSYAAIKAPIAV